MSANDGSGTTNGGPPKVITVPAAKTGEIARQGFGTSELDRRAETASTALAAQASAAVQARYVMALQRPRDLMKVRIALLADCKRPGFAEKAIYNKPVGDGIEGPSIRLAEAAARAMTNVFTDVFAIYDDDKKRIVRVSASDLEANITYTKDVTIEKTMERSKLREGQIAISTRLNSRGYSTYLVAATDDDILNKENALASKAMRTCLLRLVPGDILDEAMDQARATMEAKIKEDPDAEKKRMCDAFADVGVTVDHLKDYLGHAIETTTPAELAVMKKLFMAIKDGEASWSEAIEQRAAKGEVSAKTNATGSATPPAAKGKANLNDLAASAAATRASVQASQVAPAAGATATATTKAGPPAQQTLVSVPGGKAPPAKVEPEPEDRGDVPEGDDWGRGP